MTFCAFNAGIGNGRSVELNRANCVIVAGNHIVHAFRVAVCVNDADNWNLEIVGFGHSDTLMFDINHEQRVRQAAHIFDASDTALQFLLRPCQHQRLFLGKAVKSSILLLSFEIFELFDRAPDSLIVSQHATEPAVIDIRHSRTLCLLSHNLSCSTLGAYEKNLLLFISELGYLFESIIECWDSVFQIDDVNLVAGSKNVWLHLRVPVAALVSEMCACTEHFLHIDGHVGTFYVGLGLHTPHLSTRLTKDKPGTQKDVSVHVRH